MPKQLNVNLAFTADTHEAKAQLASLQQDLIKLTQTVGSKSPLGITKDISSAIQEVNKLQAALKNSTMDSGKLDLGQFRKELNSANLDAQKIAQSLSSLGPEGQAAFAKLAQSVTLAEVPIKKVNNTLTQFATTLANTARWQISSSILHGFIGALQSAYRYAQDLNKSLNSIRVVSGQSADQMAEFAKQANESAKALSATTTAYTDASLIFFQQGLTGDAVTERTDAVIKMSNVTGDSVEDVASYMTAIWNNFDDGSQSLEHFADVITALGAATASSSAEISAGLEKFASIAETVGLSYDYATSALATVVATTRQSADTVGTAFKTLFARIQGLKLGETLEDGVDLNKYSEALNSVGVQVLDLFGEMRDLDDILDDLAARWKLLSSAQQTALAQTVAGTRQYNQLVALMSNWDFMEENLKVARNAEGSLQEQADIYAESWEAASKRVKAAWQEIYSQLLDDKFFIELTNGFGKVLDEISNITDALGGLKGVIPVLATVVLKLFGKNLAQSINNATMNMETFRKETQQSLDIMRENFNKQNINMAGDNKTNIVNTAMVDSYTRQAEVQNELLIKARELASVKTQLSDTEQKIAEDLLDQVNKYGQAYTESARILQQENERNAILQERAERLITKTGLNDEMGPDLNNIKNLQTAYTEVSRLIEEIRQKSATSGDQIAQESLTKIGDALKKISKEGTFAKEAIEKLQNAKSPNEFNKIFNDISLELERIGEKSQDSFDNLITNSDLAEEEAKELRKAITDLFNSFTSLGEKTITLSKDMASLDAISETAKETIQSFSGVAATLGGKIVSGVNAISSFAMALSSISGIIDTVTNPDTSGIDKFIAVATSAGMSVGMMASSFKQLFPNLKLADISFKALALSTQKEALATEVSTAQTALKNAQMKLSKINLSEKSKEVLELVTAEQLEAIATKKVTAQQVFENITTKNNIEIKGKQKDACIQAISAKAAETTATDKLAIAQAKLNAAMAANPVAAVVVALAAFVAITVAAIKIREKEIEKQKEANKEEIERINKIQEEADKNKELVDSYMDLYKTYKETGENKEQLANTTDKLLEKYNLEGAALAKLTGDYDALTEAIKKARNQELARLIDETKRQIIASEGSIFPSVYEGQGGYERLLSVGNDNKIDLAQGGNRWYQNLIGSGNSLYGSSVSIEEMDQKAYDILRKYSNLNISNGLLEIDTSNPEEALAIYEDLISAYNDMQNSMTQEQQSTSAAFANIKDFISANREAFEQLEQSYDRLHSYQIEQAFINTTFDQNTSIQEIQKSIEEVTNALGSSIDNVEEYIDTYLSGIEDISSAYQKYKLAEKIVEGTRDGIQINLEEAIDLIDKYNDAQVAFLDLHLNTALLDGDLQDWMDRHAPVIEQLGEQGAKYSISNAIDTLANGQALSADTISSLFENEQAADFIGIEQSAFSSMDAGEQLQILTNAFIANSRAVVEHKEDVISSIEEEQEAYAQADENYHNLINSLNRAIGEYEEQGEHFGYTTEEIITALEEYDKVGNITKLDGNFANIIEKLIEVTNLSEEGLVNLARNAVNYKKGSEAYQSYANILKEVSNATNDYSQSIEYLNATIKQHNKIIDDIQKNYQALSTIIDNYNKEGLWTVDNVQTLIEMDDEYAASLQFEGNQLKINEEYYQQLTIAKLENLKATVIEKAETELEALAKGEFTLATYDATSAEIAHTLAVKEGIAAAEAGVEAWEKFAASRRNFYGLANSVEAKTILDAEHNRLQAIQNAIDAISAGGDSLNTALNKNSKSSGGGGSTDSKDLKEYLKEFDRLYSIKKAIEDLTDAISDLDKKKSHLLGQSLVEALEQENAMLEQQKDLYVELLHQQADYRDELAGTLEQFGATFDTDSGNLTNYMEITQNALTKYNEAVDAYNASHDKSAFEVAEQEYNFFKEVLSEYQGLLTDIEDTRNNLDDNFLQQIENNLKGFETSIQINLDFEEATRKVNNFFKDINTNFKRLYKSTQDWANIFTTATKNVDTYTEASGTIATDLKALQEVADYLNNEKYNVADSNNLFASRDDAIAKYKELSEQLMSDAQDLYDLYEDTWNNYLDAIDEVKSQWNDILKGFDKVNNTLKHYEKIVDLLYGGDELAAGREYLDQLYTASSNSSLLKQDTLRKEIDALQKEYDQILSTGVEETDKDLVELKEAIEEAESSLESEIENYLEIIQNQLTNSIKSIMDAADKAMTKGHGSDFIIERWNDARDAAEGYYDEVERVYQLERMESLWEDAISKTSTLKNQQYLTSIMNDQLKNLREKTKLSEYDIGLAEKELAIYQAQMALEDARNNKNAMKVVRNEQGNWAYQYVADEDDVADKEEDLLNKLYEKYEYVKTSNIEATESLLELYQTAQQRLSELLEEYKYADEARRLEIAEQYNYLYDYYYGPEGVIVQKAAETHAMEDDLNIAGMELLWDLYETDIENYDYMIQSEKDLIDALRDHNITTFTELVTAVATGDDSLYNQLLDKVTQVTNDSRTEWEELAKEIIEEWATNPDSVRAAVTYAYDSIMLKVRQYDALIAYSEQVSGIAWSNVTLKIGETGNAVQQVHDAVESVIAQTDELSEFSNAVRAIGHAFDDIRTQISMATAQLSEFLGMLGIASEVQIPKYDIPLNPNGGKAFTPKISENGGGSGPSSISNTTGQYMLRGHDNFGHENAYLLGLNNSYNSEEDLLRDMEALYSNDTGEMGYYYQGYIRSRETGDSSYNIGHWSLDPYTDSTSNVSASNSNTSSSLLPSTVTSFETLNTVPLMEQLVGQALQQIQENEFTGLERAIRAINNANNINNNTNNASYNIYNNFGSLELPNVFDGEDFITVLSNYPYNYS